MIDLALDTFKLVRENKLFLNPTDAYSRMAICALLVAALMVLAAYAHIPLWLSGTVGGFAGGFAIQILFKDVKFK